MKGGRVERGMDGIEWGKGVVKVGGGEILLRSMDGDGRKSGYDVGLREEI
ncbi:HisA/HisF-related TIM barrel protein [Bacillus thuringiensis]|nr:HisA/HisF-related TIM barrel protein [Bacillus thuringiensis]